MQIDLAALPDDPATLQRMLREVVTAAEQQHTTLRHAMQQRDTEIDKLHLLIKRLLRQQFGRRSEQLSADQLQLALEDLEQTIAAHEAAQDTAENKQRQRREKRPSRNHGALPAHLPRYEVLIDVAHRDCPCCGGGMHVIGELRTEQLDIVPAQLRVRVTRRPRYACRTCEGAVVVAAAPERPIDGGMATEALVAHVLVSKFCDSLPLYRQSQMLARQGIALDRSTLSNWVGRACWWLTPLYDLLVSTALACPKLFADDTTLPVLDPGRGRTKTGRIWCYAVDDRPWAGPTHPVAAYVYAEDRKGSHPARHLAAFRGVLQVDGYDGFKRLALDRADSSVTLAFCWARLPKVPCALRMEWPARGICAVPSTSSMSRRSRHLPPGCWRKSVNSTPLKPRSAASQPNTDDRSARSEVAQSSRLCTPGYRITSGASRPSQIWLRPFAMPSDTGPA